MLPLAYDCFNVSYFLKDAPLLHNHIIGHLPKPTMTGDKGSRKKSYFFNGSAIEALPPPPRA